MNKSELEKLEELLYKLQDESKNVDYKESISSIIDMLPEENRNRIEPRVSESQHHKAGLS